jgi:hypothetical protein
VVVAIESNLFDETQLKLHPIRFLKASICGSGARETATNDTSRACRCTTKLLK